jgi:glycosyltransferase involved in cell wall biosynthesis
MDRPKIAIVTSFPENPAVPQGGVQAVSVNLVRALACANVADVPVITTDQNCRRDEITAWEGAAIHRLPMDQGRLLAYALGPGRKRVQAYLSALKPDVVHSHDTYGLMVKGFAAARVFTIHGFIYEDTLYAGGWRALIRSRLWWMAERSSWAEQPHIVSISPYVRERLRGIARGMIHDIENPIASECFQLPRQEEPGTIFCAAAICERKNTFGLVKAFGQLRDTSARLRLAGPIVEPAYEKVIRAYIQQNGLANRVHLLGSLPMDQIRLELARASIFALVSFEEGAPMGVAEAMAARVPVVTSNRCGMPYMIRHGETGFLVDPTNSDDIAKHLDELCKNKLLRDEMGEKAHKVALGSFHPDRVVERTLRVYERAISEFQSPRPDFRFDH